MAKNQRGPKKSKNSKTKPLYKKQPGSIQRTVMKAHYHYTNTITAGGSTSVLKQVNLTPTMSDFDELINQAQFYQQYKLKRV